ncbi:MAG: GDSL-type esterase/lipase family protein [Mycobacteriales bacterium]
MTRRQRWRAALAAVVLAGAGLGIGAPAASAANPTRWSTAWGSAMAWGYGYSYDVTVRQLADLTLGGQLIRVRLSNAFGSAPLTIGAASIGLQSAGPTEVAGSLRPLSFDGESEVTIPRQGLVTSDPVAFPVQPGDTVEVSIYVPGWALVSVHPCCNAVSSYYTANGGGNLTGETAARGFTLANPWGRWLDAVQVAGGPAHRVVVAFGDSITDGFHTPLRWTDVLVRRMAYLPPDERLGVVNEAITANTLTAVTPSFALLGGGPPGVLRLTRDALSQPGVHSMVLLLGTNDLWFGATADEVIAGLQSVLAEARAADVIVVGSTLLPREGSERWTPAAEVYREEVNRWIRTSGAFPVVVDLGRVVADRYNGACDPLRMFPPYDSGDHLHPGPAGQTAMANAIPTQLLGGGNAPTVPPLVAVQATPGCDDGPIVVVNPAAFPVALRPTAVVPTATPRPVPTVRPVTPDPVRAAGSGGPFGKGEAPWWWAGAGVVALGGAVGLRRRSLRRSRRSRRRMRSTAR